MATDPVQPYRYQFHQNWTKAGRDVIPGVLLDRWLILGIAVVIVHAVEEEISAILLPACNLF